MSGYLKVHVANAAIALLAILAVLLNLNHWALPDLVLLDLFWLLIACAVLLSFGLIIFMKLLPKDKLNMLVNHNIVRAIASKDYGFIFYRFLFIMVFEELVFRYYLMVGLGIVLGGGFPTILLSSLIFAAYHVHMYKKLPSKIILGCFITFSFFLGLVLGYALHITGIFCCILIHFVMVIIIYYAIARKAQKSAT